MEQSAKRPPEKVLMMPSTSPTTEQQATSNNNAKKPARASLLSIISGGDKKSPKSSDSSAADDQLLSPSSTAECFSPTESNASKSTTPEATEQTSFSLQRGNSISQDNESEEQRAKSKKVPPPTLAKPSKNKPPPTATKPLKRLQSQTSQSDTPKPKVDDDGHQNPVKEFTRQRLTSSTDTAAENLEINSNEPPPADGEVIVTATSFSKAMSPLKCMNVEHEESEKTTVEDNTNGTDMITVTTVATVECELPPPVIEDMLPPPQPSDLDLPPPTSLTCIYNSTEQMEDVEFPPPPDMDFSADPELAEDKSVLGSVTDSQIQEAVDKITSKYDTSVAISNLKILQNKNSDASDPSSDSLSSKHNAYDSTEIPSQNLIHPVINMENNTTLTNNEIQTKDNVDSVSAITQTPEVENTSLHLELNKNISIGSEQSGDVIEEKTPSISSPLSDLSADVELVTSPDDDSSIDHLITPPQLPATSSFSALDNNSNSTKQSSETSHMVQTDDMSAPPNAMDDVMTDNKDNSSGTGGSGNILTVAEHVEDSNAVSSSSSTTTHSPPLNASSESGDSGIETGIYATVGETIPVKLRPTTNDNRKPDYSVPMFDKHNSGELKRVTFREKTNPITTAVNTQRSAAEEERIKRTGLSEDDVSQAELFYKGHETEVMVCPCLATLYFAESNSGDTVPVDKWEPVHIGIPVLIYDTGEGKRARGLTMVFAEKGTGFLLWKTVINYESRWEVVESVFHRLRIPGTADKLAGIAYQDVTSAESFYNYFKTCTADPEKNVLNNPNLRNKKKKEKKKSTKKRSTPLPNKTAISKPCQFTHVTQLKQSGDEILALAMVPGEEDGSENGIIE